MMLFLALSVSMIVIALVSLLISLIREDDYVDLLSLAISFFVLMLPLYFNAFYGVPYFVSIPLFILLIFLVTVNRPSSLAMNLTNFQFRKSINHLGIFFLIFVSMFFVFASPFQFKQELYVNPDPYGYASVTGAVKEFGSFERVLDQYEGQTGVPFRYDANWDNPSEFVKLESPWQIPNVTLKYGIANGYYLHNGFSFLLQKILQLVSTNEIRTFVTFWSVLTIFSATLVIGLAALLGQRFLLLTPYLEYSRNRESKPNSPKIHSNAIYFASLLATLILALNSRWFGVFIIEGFGNQLLSYAICLACSILSFDWVFGRLRTKTFLMLMSILLVTQFFVYAQQIVFQGLIVVVAVLSKVFGGNSIHSILLSGKNWKTIFTIFLLAILIPVLLNVPIVDTAIRALRQSGGGGATHLGVLSPLKTLGFYSGKFGDLVDVRDERDQNLFVETIWPASGPNGLDYKLRGQGYSIEINSINSIYLSLFIVTALTLIICRVLIRQNKYLGLFVFFNIFPLLTLETYYFYTHTGNFLIQNPNNLFNDYIWMRILAYTAVVMWPLLAFCGVILIDRLLTAKFFSLNKFFKVRSTHRVNDKEFLLKKAKRILCLLVFINIPLLASNYAQANQISYFSDNTVVIEKCEPNFRKGAVVYLSTDSIVPELLVSTCGSDVRFINDSFSVVHQPDGLRHDLYRLERIGEESWRLFKYANFLFDREIRTPCDLDCFNSLFADSFQQIAISPKNR